MTAYNRGMQHISSHWQKMLVGFDGSPESLNGVAQLSRRTRNPLHRLFQGKYLAMGREFPRFDLFLKAGRTVAKRHGRAFDLNMLRQCLTLGLLDIHGLAAGGKHFLIIGDGYAAMSSIIMESMPQSRVTLMNIAPVLEIDRLYFQRAHPDKQATFIESESLEEMPRADVSIDIACMQEINPDVRDRYFTLLAQRAGHTYSCNRTSKTFPDGTVTNFLDYPWGGATLLVDELCPWHQEFYNFRPPLFRPYDGPTWHRLVRWK